MIRNYLLVAFRNLQRNSIYSFINVSGLAIGIACAMLIMLWVADEISFDRFHKNYDQVYQLQRQEEVSGTIHTSVTVPYPLMEQVKSAVPAVKAVALTNHGEGYLLQAGETKVTKMGNSVTEDFLKVFQFEILKGDARTALADPYSVILTQSTARALFGEDDPINKIVRLDNLHDVKVTAIMQDVPAQSTLQFEFLLPFNFYKATQAWVPDAMNSWDNNVFRLFAELEPGADVSSVNTAVADIIRSNNEHARTAKVFLYPMSDWRLYSEFTNGKASGLIEYVRMFSVIGLLILIIACINFMNLATARSQNRAREVGVRKTVGSGRKQLIGQFLCESVLTATAAFVVALVFVEITLPFYNILVNKQLGIHYGDPVFWSIAISIIVVTGILSGSYPAFYLSSFKPVKVLKGSFFGENRSVTPRKALVILQFGFSIFMIIAMLVVYQQVTHVKSRHMGYDRENLLLLWTTAEREANFSGIREELKNSGAVKAVCKSSAPITRIFSSTDGVNWPGKTGDDKVSFVTFATEYGFTETMDIKMLEGRDFSPEFKSDTSAAIINQAAVEIMGLQDPIGQTIHIWGDDRTIIGVMEDVVMGSPYHPVDPMCMVLIPDWSSTISIRLNATDDVPAAIATVEKIFKKFDPEHPLWYRFADDEFQTKFTNITLVGRLAWIFTALAILISCLGLFGLAAFTAEQRTKEVGIRKVLGATVTSLVVLISKDFSKLIILAFVIASPVAWWLLENFLQKYPYRIDIAWWIIPLAGSAALILTILIVSTQALKAASINPVKSLRSE